MKTLYKFFLLLVFFFGLDKTIRTQTAGFRLEKTLADFPSNPEWETISTKPPNKILSQPYYFLGSGVQCYAFLSADEKTVLKVFKHYHLWPSSTLLRKIPFPPFLKNWKNQILIKREKRINSIFTSAKIASTSLPKQTGVFHLSLNTNQEDYPMVTIYDKIGIRYFLDLNKTPFLLQKKAEPLSSYLKIHPDNKESISDTLISHIEKRRALGIINSDLRIDQNFGILDGEVLEIDIGSFVMEPSMKDKEIKALEKWRNK